MGPGTLQGVAQVAVGAVCHPREPDSRQLQGGLGLSPWWAEVTEELSQRPSQAMTSSDRSLRPLDCPPSRQGGGPGPPRGLPGPGSCDSPPGRGREGKCPVSAPRPHSPRRPPQDPLSGLEQELALQLQIAEAARRLSREEKLSRQARRQRKRALLQEEERLRALERCLGAQRRHRASLPATMPPLDPGASRPGRDRELAREGGRRPPRPSSLCPPAA